MGARLACCLTEALRAAVRHALWLLECNRLGQHLCVVKRRLGGATACHPGRLGRRPSVFGLLHALRRSTAAAQAPAAACGCCPPRVPKSLVSPPLAVQAPLAPRPASVVKLAVLAAAKLTSYASRHPPAYARRPSWPQVRVGRLGPQRGYGAPPKARRQNPPTWFCCLWPPG